MFPKQDRIDPAQFGNAIRGPLGVHRAVDRRYWFYGAAHDLESQLAYLRQLRRVSEAQLARLIADLDIPEDASRPQVGPAAHNRPGFHILAFLDRSQLRRVGRNWVTRCPSCAAAGRDRGKDNLAVSVEEPLKYLCWAGCTNFQIRAALGASAPVLTR